MIVGAFLIKKANNLKATCTMSRTDRIIESQLNIFEWL